MKFQYKVQFVKGRSHGIRTIHAENAKEAEKVFRKLYGVEADLLRMERLR